MAYIHIYCGDGKGKTTAAIGLAVRMAGCRGRAVLVRFLKNDDSGEVDALRQIKGITVIPCRKTFGFTWQMTEKQKREAADFYRELFKEASDTALRCAEEGQTLFVMDEVCAAVRSGLLEKEQILKFLDGCPENLEVVMTGKDPLPEFTERADYISEIRKIRHPFDDGVAARKGIEY